MSKSFYDAFDEWRKDDRYKIGEDIGWEYSDSLESGPTPETSSSTPEENGLENPVKALIDPGQKTVRSVPRARRVST